MRFAAMRFGSMPLGSMRSASASPSSSSSSSSSSSPSPSPHVLDFDTDTDTDIDADIDADAVPYIDMNEACFTFWLGTCRVSAIGKPCSHHPNVVFLRVLPGTLSRLAARMLRLLPVAWSERLAARLPEWFLPDHIIMKREKRGWAEEFDNEWNLYQMMVPLQGRVVPKLYGQTEYPGTDGVRRRALIMSDIGGKMLGEPEMGSMPLDYVKKILMDAFQALADVGIDHGDPKLDNVVVVGDKIMLIDFDTSNPIVNDGDKNYAARSAVGFTFRLYRSFHNRWPQPKLQPDVMRRSIFGGEQSVVV